MGSGATFVYRNWRGDIRRVDARDIPDVDAAHRELEEALGVEVTVRPR